MAPAYLNGTYPHSALTTQGDAEIDPIVMVDLARLQGAFEKKFGTRLRTTRSYMPLGHPGSIDPANQYGARYVMSKGGPYFDKPGTSRHGTGHAVDFDVTDEQAHWLEDNAGAYNWFPGSSDEPDHYEHL